jgi:hypothetical protein
VPYQGIHLERIEKRASIHLETGGGDTNQSITMEFTEETIQLLKTKSLAELEEMDYKNRSEAIQGVDDLVVGDLFYATYHPTILERPRKVLCRYDGTKRVRYQDCPAFLAGATPAFLAGLNLSPPEELLMHHHSVVVIEPRTLVASTAATREGTGHKHIYYIDRVHSKFGDSKPFKPESCKDLSKALHDFVTAWGRYDDTPLDLSVVNRAVVVPFLYEPVDEPMN